MGIKNFFHKVKMGFVRVCETSIPQVSSTKRYGNYGEDEFVYLLKQMLPSCKIKRNILIITPDGVAEIDCLVLYENKLFAVEVKRWKGRLYETENGFVQEKTDRWTGELHTKHQKSPFKQLNRAIYLLRKSIPNKVWVNGIVFFDDDEFEEITTSSNDVWFDDIKKLVAYISTSGDSSIHENANTFFNNCVASDYLYSKTWDKSLHCFICNDSLEIIFDTKQIHRANIKRIDIKHHWSYDELYITLLNNQNFSIIKENAKIQVIDNGVKKDFALCKLDYIEFGSCI